jgi:hypothetical protein
MLSFIQNAPLETTSYMIAGYTVIFTVMLGYLASLVIRGRNMRQTYKMLEDLADNETRMESPDSKANN